MQVQNSHNIHDNNIKQVNIYDFTRKVGISPDRFCTKRLCRFGDGRGPKHTENQVCL
ncbi:Uncharacterised protein [Rikenella microfusus]|uniref:Uncharacterized protein n=1 Tax=Rikenella microfusus TaxID=28139 RepID=A0A379MU62_9BACT|nr:Uncharacterised protein [Rikenella microfusus]SUE35151.1 Uncharacterised protein [Rikenella microfusus]